MTTVTRPRPAESWVRIPGLTVLAELGRGANGTVYRVRHDGADYALKVLDRTPDTDDGALAGFAREAAMLAAIGHPGLPRIHQVGRTDGRPYLVMDLVEGRSLAGTLATGGPLPVAGALAVAAEIADALAAVHRSGLVHRDITPANIMVPPHGPARLIDFGLVTRGAGTADRSAVGTFAYAAAEQSGALNRPVDGRSDLYSLGVVLFECVTGRLPFLDDDIGTLLRMHAVTPAPDPRTIDPHLPAGLATVIGTLLAKDPDDRYGTADALLADLRALLADPAAVPAPSTATALHEPGTRLVGRAAELRTLATRWTRATAGAGGLAVLRGAPGSGRRRLAGELVRSAAAGGALVLRGRCARDEQVPLAPFRDAVSNHLDAVAALPTGARDEALARTRDAAAAFPELLAGLRAAPGSTGPAPAGDTTHGATTHGDTTHGEVAGHDQGRIALGFAALIAELARRSPGGLLLHLDDVQWLDEPGRRVLAALATCPALVVVTTGDDTESDRAVEAITASFGAAAATTVTVGPLDDEATAALVAERLPGMRIGADLARLLRVRAEGNPFTIGEYLRTIIDAGLLRPDWGDWVLDEEGLAGLDLPGHTLGLVLARIRGLDEPTTILLRTAAVIGTRFGTRVVTDACGLPADRAGAALREAVARHLLEIVGDGEQHAFVHDRIRDALLADLDPGRCAALHQQVAETLQRDSRADSDPAQLYTVARHHLRGVPGATPAAAFHACVAAARAALAGHAPDLAVEYLRHAALLGVPATGEASRPPLSESEFHQLFGTVLHRAGHLAEAHERLRAALAGTIDPIGRAAVLAEIAEVRQASWDLDGTVAAARDGLAEIGWAPRNRVLFVLSCVVLFVAGLVVGLTGIGFGTARGQRRERHRLAVALCATAGYTATVSTSGWLVPFTLRSRYAANRLGPGTDYAVAMLGGGQLAGAIGLTRTAARCYATVEALADAAGDPALRAAVAHLRGVGGFFAGHDNGQALSAAFSEYGNLLSLSSYCEAGAVLTWTAAGEGRTAELGDTLARVDRRLAGPGKRDQTLLRMAETLLLAISGRPAEAATEYRRVEALREEYRGALTSGHAMTGLVVLQEQGELGEPMEAAITRYRQIAFPVRRLMRSLQVLLAMVAFVRLEQLRAAGDDERPARIAAARRAVRELATLVRKAPQTVAWLRVAQADLAEQLGRPERALALLGRVLPTNPEVPRIGYEAARVRARCSRALGGEADTHRYAGLASAIAHDNQWPHRVRWVAAEFGVTGGRTTSHLSHASSTHAPASNTRAHGSGTRIRGTNIGSGPSFLPVELELQRLRAVEEVSGLASRTVDPQELARVILDATIRILSAERALLFLAPADQDADPDRAAAQPLQAHLGRNAAGETVVATGYSTTLVERVRATGEPLVITGTEQGAALGAQSVVLHDLRSILIAPLQLDGHLLGVVYLDSQIAKGIFTADDAGILTALTNHLATALQTARAARLQAGITAARQQHDLAEALRGALATMSSTLQPDAVLAALLDATTRLLRCDRAALLLRAGDDRVVVRGQARTGTSAAHPGLPAQPRIIHAGAGADLAELMARPHTGPADPPGPVLGQVVAGAAEWASIPLVTRTSSLGVLVLASDTPGDYQEADLSVAATLAAQAMAAHDNATLFAEVQRLATADELTGIGNRRHFLERAEHLLAAGRRHGANLGMLMIDIDHFKRINDTYGHPTGDDVIREVARRLQTTMRTTDQLGRYGGEEFAAILSPVDDTTAAAERLRLAVAGAPIETRSGPLPVTVSIGITYRPADGHTIGELLATADTALYEAKKAGRNRVHTR